MLRYQTMTPYMAHSRDSLPALSAIAKKVDKTYYVTTTWLDATLPYLSYGSVVVGEHMATHVYSTTRLYYMYTCMSNYRVLGTYYVHTCSLADREQVFGCRQWMSWRVMRESHCEEKWFATVRSNLHVPLHGHKVVRSSCSEFAGFQRAHAAHSAVILRRAVGFGRLRNA